MDENKQKIAEQILKKYNISGYVPSDKKNVDVDQRIKELREAVGSVTSEKKSSLAEKVLDFTGGKELAQGIGQTLNLGSASKQLEETQKMQFDLQGQLLQKIKENKAAGQDTSRLEKALGYITEDINTTAQGAEKLLNPNELTGKQVVGDALQLATTAAGGKVAGSIAKGATGATGVIKGALQGAGVGAATGATLGGATGFSQGLQDDKSIADSLKEAGTGALLGGVTGGVLGAVTGGVSGKMRANKLAKETQHLDAVTPSTKDLSTKEYEELVMRGKIAPKTATTPDKYILSPEEIATADKYKNLLGKDPVKNTQNLVKEIANKDTEVGKFLKSKNGIFNTGELKNSLANKLTDIDDLTVDEARLAKLKESTIDNFVKSLKKNDMETLWKARKEFDRKIESAFRGSPTLQKEIKKAFRNGIQDFISERTDDVTYKGYMKEMSNLFDLADVTNTKAAKEKGINAAQAWIKKNPGKANTIKWLGGTGVVGTIGYNLLQ